jgi:dimethylaniline monooxygenase (N-oxide forming)
VKRVAVIGAGPSGLVAVKELLEEGHEPTCFERAPGPGGVFRYDEDDGVVWESCRLTSSGLLTAFSDFPVPPDQVEQQTVGEYVGYLERYADAFGVKDRIHFGTAVESVTRETDGRWRVRAASGNGETVDQQFDAVAVCTGLHQNPYRPHFQGEETFTGRILHGAEYRRPEQIAGKRVLIVGAGESGADVVAEVAEHAAETVLSLRRGVGVLPRKIRGRPNDWLTTRISHSAAHWVFLTRNPKDERKRNVYRAAFFPLVLVDKLVQTAARAGRWLRRLLDGSRETGRLTTQLLKESGGTINEQFGTKSDEFVKALAAGRCRRAGPIARFDGDCVVFEDGGEFQPEVVILCTGFEVRIPFLSDGLASADRFHHTFIPPVGADLAFIGFLRPAFGAIPPLAELQARWFALLVSGEARLPTEAEMGASIERLSAFRQDYFRAVRGRLDYLVDYTTLCDDLASAIGCKPTQEALGRQSRRFRRHFYASPFVAAQYRLVGPHAKPKIATQVIERLPVAHPAHELGAFYLRWRLSRALHRVLGNGYEPKLVVR